MGIKKSDRATHNARTTPDGIYAEFDIRGKLKNGNMTGAEWFNGLLDYIYELQRQIDVLKSNQR